MIRMSNSNGMEELMITGDRFHSGHSILYRVKPLQTYRFLDKDPGSDDLFYPAVYDFFMTADESMHRYLGINTCSIKADAEKEALRLLAKEEDLRYKHYFIEDYMDNHKVVGIFYFYDYSTKWSRTKIGYGLSPDARGKGISRLVLPYILNFLSNRMKLCRVELEVETTNEHCLSLMEKLKYMCQIESEGIRKNSWGKNIDCNIFAHTVS